jgi:hypothetical protein
MTTAGLSAVRIISKAVLPVAVRFPPIDDWVTVNVIVPVPELGAVNVTFASPENEPPADDSQL